MRTLQAVDLLCPRALLLTAATFALLLHPAEDQAAGRSDCPASSLGSAVGVTNGSPLRTTPNAASSAVTPVTTPGISPSNPVTALPCAAVSTPQPISIVTSTPAVPITLDTSNATPTNGLR